jgi:glutamate-5-semialdehyde dehydrogenase
MQTILENLQRVKIASKTLTNLSFEKRNKIIGEIWKAIIKNKELIKRENQRDLANMDISNPMYDRLLLNDDRIISIGKWCDELVEIKNPLEKYNLEEKIETKDWLTIKKIWIPLWVVACIYEARPNVTIDLIIMCIKSWNAVILRWWKEAKNSNKILIEIVKDVLKNNLVDENLIYNYPLNREELNILYNAIWLVDVIIPRWWRSLIDSVRKNSIVPVIETWAWVVHLYLDNDIENDFLKAIDVIINAKISRPSVCNALDTLLINKNISTKNITYLIKNLKQAWIIILDNLNDNDYHIEQLSNMLSIKYVNNIEEAINHIDTYSSLHSDWILSNNKENIELFYKSVNSSVVYANTSTRFSDWSCFWFGWEIWISTQKLHARWPMWAESLVTYKYVVESNFKIR